MVVLVDRVASQYSGAVLINIPFIHMEHNCRAANIRLVAILSTSASCPLAAVFNIVDLDVIRIASAVRARSRELAVEGRCPCNTEIRSDLRSGGGNSCSVIELGSITFRASGTPLSR